AQAIELMAQRRKPINNGAIISATPNDIENWPIKLDYRLVLIGSMLPDLLDKPVWFLSQAALLPSGRSYAHSLLFNLILIAGGLILSKYRKLGLLTLALSSLTHLLLDEIWNNPVTLWWPFLGSIPQKDTTGWLSDVIRPLLLQPGSNILEITEEIIGIAVILLLIYRVISRNGIKEFIKKGTIR
ncbi:metal-dependent hydrolase, partial [bacterium]